MSLSVDGHVDVSIFGGNDDDKLDGGSGDVIIVNGETASILSLLVRVDWSIRPDAFISLSNATLTTIDNSRSTHNNDYYFQDGSNGLSTLTVISYELNGPVTRYFAIFRHAHRCVFGQR